MEYKDVIKLLSTDGNNSKGHLKKWLIGANSGELRVLIKSLQEVMIERQLEEEGESNDR